MLAHVTPHHPILFCALHEYLGEPVYGFTNPTYLFAVIDHSPLKSYYGFFGEGDDGARMRSKGLESRGRLHLSSYNEHPDTQLSTSFLKRVGPSSIIVIHPTTQQRGKGSWGWQ